MVCLLPGPAIIDETVRVAKKYLEEHPEENSYQRGDSKTRSGIEAFNIATFLGWKEYRVYDSLERLNLEKSGMVNRQAIKKEPAVIGGDRFWQNNGKPTNR